MVEVERLMEFLSKIWVLKGHILIESYFRPKFSLSKSISMIWTWGSWTFTSKWINSKIHSSNLEKNSLNSWVLDIYILIHTCLRFEISLNMIYTCFKTCRNKFEWNWKCKSLISKILHNSAEKLQFSLV